MSAVILKKEKIKGLVFTADSDFRLKVVAMLNNAAFAGEKFQATSFDEIKVILERDPLVANMIIDGVGATGDALMSEIVQLQSLILANENLLTIAYVPKESPLLDAAVMKKFPRTLIAEMPIQRDHFTKFLHDRGKPRAPGHAGVAAEPLRSALSGPVTTPSPAAKTAASEKTMDEAQRMFFEASAHVRATLEHINVLAKDRGNFEALAQIGQRFNGIFGTFALFKEHTGFKEMTALSSIIDDICRTYEVAPDPRPQEVTPEHTRLLVTAAKCSFQIMMQMRESKEVDGELIKVFDAVVAEHVKDSSISKRDSQDQVDIDALLDAEMKSA